MIKKFFMFIIILCHCTVRPMLREKPMFFEDNDDEYDKTLIVAQIPQKNGAPVNCIIRPMFFEKNVPESSPESFSNHFIKKRSNSELKTKRGRNKFCNEKNLENLFNKTVLKNDLLFYIIQGNVKKVDQILKNGININTQFNESKKTEYSEYKTDNMTPLHIACLNSEIKLVKYLVQNKANVNCQTSHGFTPLHLAISKNLAIAKNLATAKNLEIAKFLEIAKNNYAIIDFLLAQEANPTIKDACGFTPLDAAAKQDKDNVFLMFKLLKYGAKITEHSMIDTKGVNYVFLKNQQNQNQQYQQSQQSQNQQSQTLNKQNIYNPKRNPFDFHNSQESYDPKESYNYQNHFDNTEKSYDAQFSLAHHNFHEDSDEDDDDLRPPKKKRKIQ
ncbi:ankyrin repeat domain-containing protein [Candidatus Dependentiae bacterium]